MLRALQDWPRGAQVVGLLLGSEQVLAWWIAGTEPNVGAMTFAAALLVIQRVAPAQQRRNEKRDDA